MKKSITNSKVFAVIAIMMVLAFLISLTPMVLAYGHGSHEPDVLDVALEADDFTILVKAVIEADLVAALKGDGPFTVFAPTDAAFAALPDGVLEGLLNNKKQLANVLLYHVVSGKVMAEDVLTMDGAMVDTLLGEKIIINIEDGKVYIDDSQVIVTDIEASNGVIHVIDTVLVP
jgi:uncharacterized surface protein with fasciclin (FAS1) repeats